MGVPLNERATQRAVTDRCQSDILQSSPHSRVGLRMSAREEQMRALLSLVALLGLLSVANAGPKEDALAVLEKWTKAFAASDVDGIVQLYAPDALFVGTASKAVVVKPEGIRSYFENALLTNRPRGATLNDYAAMVLSDTA